jgi:hypothetical protein
MLKLGDASEVKEGVDWEVWIVSRSVDRAGRAGELVGVTGVFGG